MKIGHIPIIRQTPAVMGVSLGRQAKPSWLTMEQVLFTARNIFLAISAASTAAMLYVGAYQVRAVEHLKCPLLGHGCEAVADASFARPFGIPDGFIGAGLYALLIGVALLNPQIAWVRYCIRAVALVAAVVNILGVIDMSRFGAYCFYCLLTTALTPFLVWTAFLL
jgi:uncharacterized membrane protein